MLYKVKNGELEEFYEVEYDEEKLKIIIEKLKDYDYETIGNCGWAGSITRWPANKKTILRRVKKLMPVWEKQNSKILEDTFVHHKENGNDYITFDYVYTKLPDLYDYLDILINKKPIIHYQRLFGKYTNPLNMFYVVRHSDQLLINELLGYIDSKELTDHSRCSTINRQDDYDYRGLNELYKETLACFSFKLQAVKEDCVENKPVSGVVFQKKR